MISDQRIVYLVNQYKKFRRLYTEVMEDNVKLEEMTVEELFDSIADVVPDEPKFCYFNYYIIQLIEEKQYNNCKHDHLECIKKQYIASLSKKEQDKINDIFINHDRYDREKKHATNLSEIKNQNNQADKKSSSWNYISKSWQYFKGRMSRILFRDKKDDGKFSEREDQLQGKFEKRGLSNKK